VTSWLTPSGSPDKTEASRCELTVIVCIASFTTVLILLAVEIRRLAGVMAANPLPQPNRYGPNGSANRLARARVDLK
jgi:hypothetical protein